MDGPAERNDSSPKQSQSTPVSEEGGKINSVGESELLKFTSEVKSLSLENLDRDIAEILSDIEFLAAQLEVEGTSYDPDDMQEALSKLSFMKTKAQVMKVEYAKRQESQGP